MTEEEIAAKKSRNPRWHKPVRVNKVERKKLRLVITLRNLMETIVCGWAGGGYRSAGGPVFPLGPGIVIWNDCNHRSFRFMRRTSNGFRMNKIRRGPRGSIGLPRTYHRSDFL